MAGKRTKIMTSVDAEVLAWIDALAEAEERPRSSAVRRILTHAYKRYKEEQGEA